MASSANNIVSSILNALKIPDATDWLCRFFEEEEEIVILLYHRVSPEEKEWEIPAIRPDVFDAQMVFLKENYHPISLDTWVRHVRYGDPLPEKRGRRYAIVTFDDGHKDNFEHAYPILKRHDIPATFYISTGLLDATHDIWTTELGYILCNSASPYIFAEGRYFKLHSPRLRLRAKDFLIRKLNASSPEEKRRLIKHLRAECEVPEGPDKKGAYMTWEDCAKMSADPLFDFDAHTLTHPNLSGLSGEELENEMRRSRDLVSEKLQAPVASFAYPFGGEEDVSLEAVEKAAFIGFESAVTTKSGFSSPSSDIYRLKRVSAPFSLEKFKIKMTKLPELFTALRRKSLSLIARGKSDL